MACNKWEEMGLLFDSGELNEREKRTFDDHLAQCSECQQELKAYRYEREHFYSAAVLEESPSAACDAEIIRVCSDGRKKVAAFQLFPAFLRKSVVAVALFLVGFSVVGYIQVQQKASSGVALKQTTISAPASTMIAETAPGKKADSTTDSSEQQNPTNYANTRGNLDLNGVYPVDLQNK